MLTLCSEVSVLALTVAVLVLVLVSVLGHGVLVLVLILTVACLVNNTGFPVTNVSGTLSTCCGLATGKLV